MAKKPTEEQIQEYLAIFDKINTDFEQMELEEVEELLQQKEEFEMNFDTSCVSFEKDGLYGLKDFTGKVIIPAEYDDTWNCNYDLLGSFNLGVQKGGKWAIIASDGSGKLLTGFDYDSLEYDGDMFICEKKGKMGLLDEEGSPILPCEMESIESLSDELVSYVKNGKTGFVYTNTETGDITKIPASYDEFEIEDGRIISVTAGGDKGYVDKNGKFTTIRQEAWLVLFQDEAMEDLFDEE